MKNFLIGKNEAGKVFLDLPGLIKGKLLAAASSGGGKSNLIRLICEVLYGHVPIIILDREGEFASLRKVCPDFLTFGKDNDMPIHAGMAKALALRLWENRCSAIIDLFEMPEIERHKFVAIFTQAFIDAPKTMWKPLILLYDEAHKFCPENGEGSSEAKGPIIELSSVARKRLIGIVLATQRAAKLDKSAISECRNLMVGFLNRHDDRKSLGKELGFSSKEELFGIKMLKEGEFWMLGPAISREVSKVQVDLSETNPKDSDPLSKRFKAPPPSAKVKMLLDKLKDLPKQAEEEAKTEAELKKQVAELKRQLVTVQRQPITKPVTELSESELKRVRAEYQKQVNKLTEEFDRRRIAEVKKAVSELREAGNKAINEVAKRYLMEQGPPKLTIVSLAPGQIKEAKALPRNTGSAIILHSKTTLAEGEMKFGACEKAIVGFLAFKPERTWTKIQVAVGTGYSVTSGGFNNSLGKLRSVGAITGSGDALQLKDPNICPGTQPKENPLEAWKSNLGKCERQIWDVLMEFSSQTFTKEELGEKTGYSPTSGGFNNALGRLNSLALIERVNGGICLNSKIEF